MHNLRSALRNLARSPGFTTVAIITLTLGIGLSASSFFGLTVFLQRAMPGMTLPGLWLLGITMLVLAATALLACWLPARSATRINPIQALRTE